ncbi:hypothetical protein FHG87_011496 [Trinorchestia longiramus]|nr:hypothetical protein FHG87_011496 [Trinorchestia longiramus]
MFAKVRTSHLQHKEDRMLATVKRRSASSRPPLSAHHHDDIGACSASCTLRRFEIPFPSKKTAQGHKRICSISREDVYQKLILRCLWLTDEGLVALLNPVTRRYVVVDRVCGQAVALF